MTDVSVLPPSAALCSALRLSQKVAVQRQIQTWLEGAPGLWARDVCAEAREGILCLASLL